MDGFSDREVPKRVGHPCQFSFNGPVEDTLVELEARGLCYLSG